jgi:dephospho-CoA kinase
MSGLSPRRPYVVGLTGGIGSGKSTVSRLFAQHGVEVIDADEVSRDLVVPGSATLGSLVQRFGPAIIDNSGALRRDRLRGLIFTDPQAKTWVEQLLHPLIRRSILDRIECSNSSYVLLSAPLLLENSAYGFVDRILVVDVPEALQLVRTMLRDSATKDEVKRIMSSQLARGERLAAADDILDNSGNPLQLQDAVLRLKQRYEELAHARHQAD